MFGDVKDKLCITWGALFYSKTIPSSPTSSRYATNSEGREKASLDKLKAKA